MLGLIVSLHPPQLPNLLFSPFDGGPLGYRPQLEASAMSPDGKLSVKVFRQRNPSYSWHLGAEMHLKVYDRQDRILFEKMIGRDGMWSELDDAFHDIRFDGDSIRTSQLWGRTYSISRSELER